MATDWYMEGPWFKNCNCAPGCPCDFNQYPTQGHCDGLVAMRIDKGHFGDVDLSGLCWAGVVRWPGALHEGNGELQPVLDAKATEEQLNALGQALSGQHGDTLMEIVSYICPTVHDPIVEAPDPYRVLVRIPNGFEYTGPGEEAETALAKRLVSKGAIEYNITDGHSSMAYVRHGNDVKTGAVPTVVA